MNGFKIFCLGAIPEDVGICIATEGHISNQIFDENRVRIRLFGHMLFIWTLEEAEELGASRFFAKTNHILDPHGLCAANGKSHVTTLVVGTVCADGLRARAKGGNRNGRGDNKIEDAFGKGRAEDDIVIKEARGPADGSLFLQKKRKLNIQMSAVAFKSTGGLLKDVANVFHVHHRTVGTECLNEAAHVGPFEVVGKIDRQLDGGHGALGGMVLISNLHRIPQGFDPHSVDGQLPVVAFALGVFQHVKVILRDTSSHRKPKKIVRLIGDWFLVVSMANNLFDLSDEVAVVVGATGVLGGGMAVALASAGARVVVSGRSVERGNEKVREITKAGGRAIFFQTDATDRESLMDLLDFTADSFGIPSVLVNAAGGNDASVTVTPENPFSEIAVEDWVANFDLNLIGGALLPCQVIGAAMVEAGRGSIINIASVSAHLPLSRVVAYSSAKAAVLNLTQFLAREWAPSGVRVNSITPGFFPAEQNLRLLFNPDGTTTPRAAAILGHTPMARFGDADELSGAVIFLASPQASSFVTGSDIRVDGGYLSQTI